MRLSHSLLCFGIMLTAGSAFAQEVSLPKKVTKAIDKVKAEDVKAHIQYLADDKLQGRLPGTPGYQMAVDYVIKHYKAVGVQPGGENNSYLQKLRMRRSFVDGKPQVVVKKEKGTSTNLTSGLDITVYPHPEQASVQVDAPVVFAGYGISAPDLGYDDYANIDAKGKIVMVLRGAPTNFHSTVAAYSMDLLTVLKTAAAKGAVGVMIAATNPKAPVPNLQKGVNSVLGPDGKTAVSRSYVSDQIKFLANVNAATLQQFLSSAKLDTATVFPSLKGGKSTSAALPLTVQANYRSAYQDFDSYNVVGKIPGADPQLKEEYVVHSAHLDHIGISTPVNGDSLYNGAHDNASGVSSLLEIARVYSKVKSKPKRSVLLVMVTGEEMGLLGSAYFAKHPTVPVQNIVADVNTDMPTIIAPLLSVVALGAEHSSLQSQVAQAANYLKLSVEADPEPDQNRFIRSDQYSFVTQGIPALHIKYGNKTADGLNNLNKTVEKWRAQYYHKPQDDINGVFDFNAGKKYVQLNFLIGYLIAQSTEKPTWNSGDFFGTRFK